MSVSKWRWTEACDGRPCPGDCDNCSFEPMEDDGMTNEEVAIMKYGMRNRGFSIGCQPMEGLIERIDDASGRYHDILIYDRELTPR